jgi:hypothetical protein
VRLAAEMGTERYADTYRDKDDYNGRKYQAFSCSVGNFCILQSGIPLSPREWRPSLPFSLSFLAYEGAEIDINNAHIIPGSSKKAVWMDVRKKSPAMVKVLRKDARQLYGKK